MPSVEYPNLRSRIFLKGMFERQYVVPEAPSRFLESFLKWYERRVLKVDLSGISVDRPIFLLGVPRSGTTMLQDLCCTHPQLAYVTNAMHQFTSCFCAADVLRKRLKLNARGERYVRDSVFVDGGSPNEGMRFWAEWFGWDPHNNYYVPRDFEDFSPDEIARVDETIRRIIWCFGGRATRFFSKNPGLIPDIPLLRGFFPDAKFVHIVRDPRNCANSMLKLYRRDHEQLVKIRSLRRHGVFDDLDFVPYPRVPKLTEYIERWGAEDLRTTAHVWRDCLNIVDENRGRLNSFYQVRFEDILANPRQEMFKLLEFCELAPVGDDNDAFWSKLNGVGKIHHKNHYGDFEVVHGICREEMQRLGYV